SSVHLLAQFHKIVRLYATFLLSLAMHPIPISSLDDPRVSTFAALPRRNAQDGRFVVEGEWLVQRICRSRYRVDAILCGEPQVDRIRPFVPETAAWYVMTKALMDRLLGFNFHRGVLASATRDPIRDIATVIPPTDAGWTIVGCPEIADPVNLGRILRLSAGFGARGVLIPAGGADPFSRQALRVSMGAPFQMPVVVTDNFTADLQRLRQAHGAELAASVLDSKALPLGAYRRPSRLCLLLGSEGGGLSDEMKTCCDVQLTIPMRSGVDSFNVADACAIFLYQLCPADSEPRSGS
ncbi:MAG: RNA methyltransferase, partial [Planctomycetota bacterium]